MFFFLFSTGVPAHFRNAFTKAYGATFDDSFGGYKRPSCDGDNLPNLEFTFGEAKIVMPPEDLLMDTTVWKSYKISSYCINAKLINVCG